MRAPTLIALSGLPGTGKTTIARHLAARIGAFHLRIDTIEAGLATSSLAIRQAEDAGYVAACGMARDNLRLGATVIADSVNPDPETRNAWHEVARSSEALMLDVEIVCSDRTAHRRRVEGRVPDLAGLALPDWAAVEARHYQPWDRPVLRIDTAAQTPEACATRIAAALDAAA